LYLSWFDSKSLFAIARYSFLASEKKDVAICHNPLFKTLMATGTARSCNLHHLITQTMAQKWKIVGMLIFLKAVMSFIT
jgi:hypothetical protein